MSELGIAIENYSKPAWAHVLIRKRRRLDLLTHLDSQSLQPGDKESTAYSFLLLVHPDVKKEPSNFCLSLSASTANFQIQPSNAPYPELFARQLHVPNQTRL